MRVLKVIHGYPPRYNAGSEVYSQTLCRELAKRHGVRVFTREEDASRPDGATRVERDGAVTVHVVNAARVGMGYRSAAVEAAFAALLDEFRPQVVHIGHLHHLSLGLPEQAARRGIPIVHTLHDFWLMCPRGQFIQHAPPNAGGTWPLCDGQENAKCARHCMTRHFSGDPARQDADTAYWADWVTRRMAAARRVVELADHCIAPSRFLSSKFHAEFNVPRAKLSYLDYGFDHTRLRGRKRGRGGGFVFGYIGTHVPGKGVACLLRAFAALVGDWVADARLIVWGRPREETAGLAALVDSFPVAVAGRVQWAGEYRNERIVTEVFNRVDAIVVPSIWFENAPLVIHEAQQCGLPVITADLGGMAEYVRHEENGLLFAPRDAAALARQMRRLVERPDWARELGRRGYLYAPDGNIPDIQTHAEAIEAIYRRVIEARDAARVDVLPAPWRATFDTNPDHCNLRCVMCEEHSSHSESQTLRRRNKQPRRLMPVEMIERVARSLAGRGLREIIPSTMGEPLLYADFERVIDLCRELGLRLNLTTNGTFPRLGVRRWAELLVPVCSDVKVSWNGARRESYEAVMAHGDWDAALANTREFARVRDTHAAAGGRRCRLTLQATFMECWIDELPDLARLAVDLGADRLKGHHLWAHFAEIKDQDMRRDRAAPRRWNEIVEETRRVAAGLRTHAGAPLLLENIEPLDAIGPDRPAVAAGKCPFLGREVWIDTSGRFNPCCAPDAERRELGEFGNVGERDVAELWEGEAYRLLVSSYRSRATCLKCNMRGT